MGHIRNRIVEHVTVRAGDLVPHPYNFRRHPEEQREALRASLDEVGFARSLLGYRRADGRIQLIDGHLRAEMDPDLEVTVELLDVSDEEAHKLLLSLDPLAALAETDARVVAELAELVETDSAALESLWQSLAREEAALASPPEREAAGQHLEEQFLVLVECASEAEQVKLLKQFRQQGLTCKALVQ
jgi:hypothetical protein